MLRKFTFLIMLIVTLSAHVPVFAQSPACDMPALNQLIDTFSTSLKELKDSKPTDPLKVSNLLQTMSNFASITRAACDGLAFSGSKQLVIGPITIPTGIYRAVATTAGPFIANVTVVDGECERHEAGEQSGIFALNKGDAADGAEAVFTSKGCTALIEISLVRADWKLAFERISTQ